MGQQQAYAHRNVISPPIQRIQQPIIQQQQVVQKPIVNQQQQQSNDGKAMLEVELKKCLQKIYDKENEQLNLLASHQKQLDNHTTTINQIKGQQSKEKELLLQRRQNLQIKIEASEQWLKENENKEEIQIDDVVVPSDIWSQQCLDAVAMDFAITDVI